MWYLAIGDNSFRFEGKLGDLQKLVREKGFKKVSARIESYKNEAGVKLDIFSKKEYMEEIALNLPQFV